MQSPDEILKKISSFSHGERNQEKFKNIDRIEKKIKSQENIFDLGFNYKKVNIDDTYPKYIYDNLNKFKDWII